MCTSFRVQIFVVSKTEACHPQLPLVLPWSEGYDPTEAKKVTQGSINLRMCPWVVNVLALS